MGPTHRLAIDLGTCHTVAVVRRGDEPPRPLLFDGSPLLPSGVYAAPDGSVFVGRDAERMSQVEPSRFEPFPKRRVDEGAVLLGDSEVPVVEIFAALLRRVAAESVQGGVNPAGTTVLTCPADWGPQRRGILLAAARAADLGPVALVDEPIAAATYCQAVLNQQVPVGQCLAVFDFGGGTLDITVVRRDPGGLQVMAVGGLDDLGGVDFDAALVGHLGQLVEIRDPEVWRRLDQPARPAEQRDRKTLWSEVRAAKEMLSRASAAPVHVPGLESAVHLTREELERVVGPLVGRAVDETRRVLQRAGFPGTGSGAGNGGGFATPAGNRLAGIFLVGGSSRIPLVASRLHARFGVAPTVPEQPELPVAYGALLATVPGAPGVSGPGGYGAAPVSGPGGYGAVPVSGPGAYPPAGQVSPPGPVSGPGQAGPYPTSPAGAPDPVPPSVSFPPINLDPSQMPGQHGPVPGQYGPVPGTPGQPATAPGQPGPLPFTGPHFPGPKPGGFGPGGSPVPGGPAKPGRRRSGRARYVSGILAVVLLAACATGGRTLYNAIFDAGSSWGKNTGLGGGSGSGIGGFKGKALTSAASVTLPGDQAMAMALGADTMYYAAVGADKTDVTAVAIPGGQQRWKSTVQAEPAKLSLKVVGDLLLFDGDQTDTHDNATVRGVLDAKTGALKWLDKWEDRIDIEYLGTDVVVQQEYGTDTGMLRVDLLTGKTRWEVPKIDDMYITDDRISRPSLVWGPGTAGASPAAETGYQAAFTQPYGVDGGFVVLLDESKKQGQVINAADKSVKVTGSMPFDAGQWLVYANLAIGQLYDSHNRIAAYELGGLKQKWGYQLPAGSSVDEIHPCGQQLVCLVTSGGTADNVVAIDITSGTEKWKKAYESINEAAWSRVGDKLLVGDRPFQSLSSPMLVNPENGEIKNQLGTRTSGISAVASNGARIAVTGTKVTVATSKVTWQIAILDPADGAVLGAADASASPPESAVMSAGAVAVLTKERKVLVFNVPKPG